MNNYKRKWRELSDEHKHHISKSSTGKPKSAEHREHISQGLRDYWAGVPHKPRQEGITMDEFFGINTQNGKGDGKDR